MVCTGIKTSNTSLNKNHGPRRFLPWLTILIILSLAFFVGCKEQPVIEVVKFPQSFADLVDKVQPAVVNISTTTTVRVPGHPFQHFFGQTATIPLEIFLKISSGQYRIVN